MTTSPATSQLGRAGEQLAADELRRRGYGIITMNWRCRYGEVDIIARQGGVLVFVEVRTRRASSVTPAFESINPAKRHKMTSAALEFIRQANAEDCAWRVDVIAIGIPAQGEPRIEHIEDALGW
jgi:putative endonuclease